MEKGVLVTIIVVAVLIVLGFILFGNQGQEGTNGQLPLNIQDSETSTGTINIVEMRSSGFSPRTIRISVGDEVTFTNVDLSRGVWPASASHPTHLAYPGSGRSKCGTEEEGSIFDACKGIDPGESYSFTFDEVGTWRYHNHLIPSYVGTVIVS